MAYKQLTDEERCQIEVLKREGFNQSEIACSLNQHPSTINRERARNSDHKGYRGKEVESAVVCSTKKQYNTKVFSVDLRADAHF